jgi:hypothetical protein
MPKKKYPKVELTCIHCGKKWTVSYGLRHRKFCSNQCRGKFQYDEGIKNKNNKLLKYIEENGSFKKGKTHVELYGKKRAEEIKNILSESKKGEKNPAKRIEVRKKISKTHKKRVDNGWESPMKGSKFSDERKKQMGEITKEVMSRPEVKEKIKKASSLKSEKMKKWHKENKDLFIKTMNKSETKQKMRESHIKAMRDGKYSNKKDTDIELFIEKLLIQNGWEENKDYFKQYPFPEKNPKYLLDFYLPDFKLNIEGMGCYWHKCSKCGYGPSREVDRKRIKVVNDNGINVLNLWSHSMKTYTFKDFRSFIVNDLMDAIK